MTIGLLFIIVAVIGVGAACVWNFVPGIRDRFKGWSTIIETVMTAVWYGFGQLTGGIQDAVAAGYIPSQIAGYIPYVIFIYIILKRFGTTTPVGVKP